MNFFRLKTPTEYFNLATHLKVLNLTDCSINDLTFLPTSLKTLTLSFEYLSWETFEKALPELNLKHLTLFSLKLPVHCFEAISSLTQLRSLRLKKSGKIDLEKLSNFIKKIPLRHLSLKESKVTGDFKAHFKDCRLQSLNVSITSIGIKEITLAFLKKLTISDRGFVPKQEIDIENEENLAFLKTINGLRIVKQNRNYLRVMNSNA